METLSKRRNKDSQSAHAESPTVNQQDEEKVQQAPQKTLKYYFNRFRYYHYRVAETVDTFIGVVCLTIIKLYFFLMGWEYSSLQGDGKTDAMDIEHGY